MKNLLVFLMAFAVIGTASATTVTNGEFTADMADWAFIGNTAPGAAVADHNTAGGNPNGFAIIETAGGIGKWGVWYQVGLEDFNELGIPPGWGVTMQCDVKAIGASDVTGAALKIETWAAGGSTPISDYTEIIPTLTTSWATYDVNFTSAAAGIGLKCVLVTADSFGGATNHGFDNVEILVRGGTPALRPVPINKAGVNYLTTTSLSWEDPAGAIDSDVYLQDFNDPCASPDPRGSGILIANDTTDESAVVTLADDKHYYWVVDANGAGDVNGTGFIWYFQTADAPPDVTIDDQYLVTDGNGMVITLDATVTDDFGIASYAWTDITVAADQDPDTTVVINTPTTEDTTVTLTNTVSGVVTGYYQFTLTVTDTPLGQVTAETPIIVGVYGTCAEAATEDPCDVYDDTADINGDCKKDLKDLALLGAGWLDCNANRIACP